MRNDKYNYLKEQIHLRAIRSPVSGRYIILTVSFLIIAILLGIYGYVYIQPLRAESVILSEIQEDLSETQLDFLRKVNELEEAQIFENFFDHFVEYDRHNLVKHCFRYEIRIDGKRISGKTTMLQLTANTMMIEITEELDPGEIPIDLLEIERLFAEEDQLSDLPVSAEATLTPCDQTIERIGTRITLRYILKDLQPGEIITLQVHSKEMQTALGMESDRIEIFHKGDSDG